MYIYIFLFELASGTLYSSGLFTMGPNLILNPSFMNAPLPSGTINNNYYNPSLVSWNCSPLCEIQNTMLACGYNSLSCNTTFVQDVDLDSTHQFNNLSQTVSITNSTEYLILIDWMPALVSPLGKTWTV